MSVVAARVYPDRIEMAADSQTTYDTGLAATDRSDRCLTTRNPHKLFQTPEGLTIGGTGETAVSQLMLLWAQDQARAPEAGDRRGITNWFVRFRRHAKDLTGDEVRNKFLVVYEGRLWRLEADCLYVEEVTSFAALAGVTQTIALTTMYLGKSPREAVDVACDMTITCSGPVIEYVIPRMAVTG